MFFATLVEALLFYKVYALSYGFEPRLYTTKKLRGGEIYKKYVVCNRQGYKENKNVENKGNTRLVKITRDAHLQKLTRKLNAFHKHTIINNSNVNIGASTSFRLCKEYTDGYENVGASLTDFKNLNRDIKCFIGSKDAQMFIDRFKEIAETHKGFYFAYYTDEAHILPRVFCCDSQSTQNYSLFGDAVSFDVTYRTNKYDMVFAPFTGGDHHKKSVTFGARLLEHEDDESFKWCFEKFLDAMNQKEPQCFITDQDPALILAVPAVFNKARHRFCIWHIMQKVTVKVGSSICKDTGFLSRFNSVFWDITLDVSVGNIAPTVSEFEFKWAEVIKEFKLEDNSWLDSIYGDRAKWIHAYFTDLPMGCILRTMQISESENSFFKRLENKFGTLVEFWLRFQSVMDQHRYAQTCVDKDSDHSLPNLVSPLAIVKDALTVYTHAVFKEFREEVETAICSCGVVGVTYETYHEYSEFGDGIIGKIFQSCGKQLSKIPEKYILKCWTMNSYRTTFIDAHGTVDENVDATHYHNLAVSNVWTEFYSIIPVLKSLPEGQVQELSNFLKSYREKFCSQSLPMTKDQEMEQLLGV
ncbi:protein FAR1-RELATED SEQUENCE 5-like [Silene latifolia]|uniref:protein FAR1-RELATED SEQUENCE 5-like n=1 Tax=Silene latifolia TaxID=37657 RepID=UPI003D77CC39